MEDSTPKLFSAGGTHWTLRYMGSRSLICPARLRGDPYTSVFEFDEIISLDLAKAIASYIQSSYEDGLRCPRL